MASTSAIDCMTVIQNGVRRGLQSVDVARSDINIQLLRVLMRGRFIRSFMLDERVIHVKLALLQVPNRRILQVSVCSTPSTPLHVTLRVLRSIQYHMGSSVESLTIISTPRGLLNLTEALAQHQGGELLFGANPFVLGIATRAMSR